MVFNGEPTCLSWCGWQTETVKEREHAPRASSSRVTLESSLRDNPLYELPSAMRSDKSLTMPGSLFPRSPSPESISSESESLDEEPMLVSPQKLFGKEKQLVAAKEKQRRNERRGAGEISTTDTELERARDKERIRALEEEIQWLKDEVRISPLSGHTQQPHALNSF
jgi:hypothetical protein